MSDDRAGPEAVLGLGVNRPGSTQFSQWVSPSGRTLIFARYTERDAEQTGLFVSRRDGNLEIYTAFGALTCP